jgi:hypothetical protein
MSGIRRPRPTAADRGTGILPRQHSRPRARGIPPRAAVVLLRSAECLIRPSRSLVGRLGADDRRQLGAAPESYWNRKPE